MSVMAGKNKEQLYYSCIQCKSVDSKSKGCKQIHQRGYSSDERKSNYRPQRRVQVAENLFCSHGTVQEESLKEKLH